MATTDTSPPPTAPLGAAIPPDGSVAKLVSGIVEDAQTLLRQQAEMLKAEVREDFQRSKRAAEFGALGVVCATVGALSLIWALAWLLHDVWGFAHWASWGIVGGLFMIAGVALGGFSYVLLERFNPLPDKTFNALKENLTWQTK
jgi:hypothetical protein